MRAFWFSKPPESPRSSSSRQSTATRRREQQQAAAAKGALKAKRGGQVIRGSVTRGVLRCLSYRGCCVQSPAKPHASAPPRVVTKFALISFYCRGGRCLRCCLRGLRGVIVLADRSRTHPHYLLRWETAACAAPARHRRERSPVPTASPPARTRHLLPGAARSGPEHARGRSKEEQRFRSRDSSKNQ